MYLVKSLRLFVGTNAERTAAGLGSFLPGDEYHENDTSDTYQHDGMAWIQKNTGGTPGGSDTQIQYNNGGVFGGFGVWDDAANQLLINGTTAADSGSVAEFHDTTPTTILAVVNDSASNDANVGVTSYYLKNSIETQKAFGGFIVGSVSRTNGMENGYFRISTMFGGTVTPIVNVEPSAITLNYLQNDTDTIIKGDTATNLLVAEAGTDTVQIGTTVAGDIASFGPSAIVLNNGEADRDVRIAGNGVTNGYFYDAGNDRHGFGTATPEHKMSIVLGSAGGILASDVVTNNTNKDIRILLRHYDNSEEAISVFGGASFGGGSGNSTEARFGGGYGIQNAVTKLRFFAAPNNTTLSGTEIVTMINTGVGIGTGFAGPATSAILELSSTTGALLLPRMTTTQRNALTAANGMVIYNTTNNRIEAYENGSWVDI